MADIISGTSLEGLSVHLTGIKGTGMAALAELLLSKGAEVSGSDVPEKFYTDEILTRLGVHYTEEFSAANLQPGTQLVVHSAAYDRSKNPELIRAAELGIPILSYPEALGLLSRLSDSTGVAGVHGKTTTTAMAGTILKRLGLPASVLVGSAVSSFGDSSTLSLGSRYFVAETCEYRRHFLSFDPSRILLTSVEPDHLDYFRDYDDILEAFKSYADKLHEDGTLIYCADDRGANEVAEHLRVNRPDVRLVPYGFAAPGRYRIVDVEQGAGRNSFRLDGVGDALELLIPGKHSILDAAGAAALCCVLWEAETGQEPGASEWAKISDGLRDFRGSRRRSEIIGEANGVLVIDDYGHHPTAIRTTLAGLRSFYPGRRIIADFMSHTYSRTQALLEDFAGAFEDADIVILHKIYASARERAGTVSGRDLFEATARRHPAVHYFEEVEDALPFCLENLTDGDLFVTMGAGNNWTLSRAVLHELGSRSRVS